MISRRKLITRAPLFAAALPSIAVEAAASLIPDDRSATVDWFFGPPPTRPVPGNTLQFDPDGTATYGPTISIIMDAIDPDRDRPFRVQIGHPDQPDEFHTLPVYLFYRHHEDDIEENFYHTPSGDPLECGCRPTACEWNCRCLLHAHERPGSNTGLVIRRRLANSETGTYHPDMIAETYLPAVYRINGADDDWPYRVAASGPDDIDTVCYQFATAPLMDPEPVCRVDWVDLKVDRFTARFERVVPLS